MGKDTTDVFRGALPVANVEQIAEVQNHLSFGVRLAAVLSIMTLPRHFSRSVVGGLEVSMS